MATDYSREAAHKRYEQAADIAANAGAGTQSGLLDVYKNLLNNSSWQPNEENLGMQSKADWAASHRDSAPMYVSGSTYSLPEPQSNPNDGSAIDSSLFTQPAQSNLADDIWEVSPWNPANWGTEQDQARYRKQKEYRESNPMREDAFAAGNGSKRFDEALRGIGMMFGGDDSWINNDESEQPWDLVTGRRRSSDAVKSEYEQYFADNGGLEEGYNVGSNDVLRGIGMMFGGDDSWINNNESEQPWDLVNNGFDRMSRENFDDGTMRADSVKSKYMDGKTYKKYVELGMGGRPVDEIDDNAVYNKLDEMRDYNFVPYIEDNAQWDWWNATQLGNDVSKGFNLLGQARDHYFQPTFDFDGTKVNVREFDNAMAKALSDIDNGNLSNIKYISRIPNDDGSVQTVEHDGSLDISSLGEYLADYLADNPESSIASSLPFDYLQNNPDAVIVSWPDGKISLFDDPDEIEIQSSPVIEYEQLDGSNVRIPLADYLAGIKDGSIKVDYGPLNLGKNADERKDFTEMLTTADPSDLLPNMVDLILGSAPLFFNQTAWPMAISNAEQAAWGLEPRSYNALNNTYSRLSEDMNADKYLSNIVLSGLMPATERIAGFIGGTGGVVGRPIMKALEKRNASPTIRELIEILGEGAEEIVAGLWEDAMSNGWRGTYANPVYKTDENGEVVTDPATGEPIIQRDAYGAEVRDLDTPMTDRAGNFFGGSIENGLAGTALGGLFGIPRWLYHKKTKTGPYSENPGKFNYKAGDPDMLLNDITAADFNELRRRS